MVWCHIVPRTEVIKRPEAVELLRGSCGDYFDRDMSLLNEVVRPPNSSTSAKSQFTPYEITAPKERADSNRMEATFAIFFNIFGREARLVEFELKGYRVLPFCARIRII